MIPERFAGLWPEPARTKNGKAISDPVTMSISQPEATNERLLRAARAYRKDGLAAYGLALFLAAASFAASLAMFGDTDPWARSMVVLPAVIVAAIIGGIGPGTAALGALMLGAVAFGAGSPLSSNFAGLAVFALTGAIAAGVGHLLRVALEAADRADQAVETSNIHLRYPRHKPWAPVLSSRRMERSSLPTGQPRANLVTMKARWSARTSAC